MKKELILRNFKNIPVLQTDRLCLRKILVSDYQDMYEYSKRDDVTKYLLWNKHPSLEYTKQYTEYLQSRYRIGDYYDWAIELKEEKKMIGTCGFTRFDYSNNSAEIGYVLNPEYWHLGYCSEAVRKIIEFGFTTLKLNRIEAKFMKENTQSLNVMQGCGMKLEGYLRKAIYSKSEYRDIGICAILQEDFSF